MIIPIRDKVALADAIRALKTARISCCGLAETGAGQRNPMLPSKVHHPIEMAIKYLEQCLDDCSSPNY